MPQTDAARRLRRARSNTTVQQSSEDNHATFDDHDSKRREALAAANTAYAKAYGRSYGNLNTPARSESRPRLSRHQSNASGRSEGSHLQAARLNARTTGEPGITRLRNRIRDEEVRHSYASNTTMDPLNALIRAADHAGAPVDRENVGQEIETTITTVKSGLHTVRKTPSVYNPYSYNTDPVVPPTPAKASSTWNSEPPYINDDSRRMLLDRTTGMTMDSLVLPTHDLPTSPVLPAPAGDPASKNRPKIRQRPSLLLGAFQKRSQKFNTEDFQNKDITYDDAVTAFNRATGADVTADQSQEKRRSTSSSFRNRLRKVFRKSSNGDTTEVPKQQIEATRRHFGDFGPTVSTVHSPSATLKSHHDFTRSKVNVRGQSTEKTPEVPLESRKTSAHSNRSDIETVQSKSRVTSWSNSTIAGFLRLGRGQRLSVIDEDAKQYHTSSATSRYSASIRSFRNRLQTKPSEETVKEIDSKRIYSALMKRIEGQGSDRTELANALPPLTRRSSILDTLPSQQKRLSSMTSAISNSSTIRIVTPEKPSFYRLPSAIPEQDSDDEKGTLNTSAVDMQPVIGGMSSSTLSLSTFEEPVHARRKRLRKRALAAGPPCIPTAPSREEIASRVEKSTNRWKSQLEAGSPMFPKVTKRAFSGDHPQDSRNQMILSRAGTPARSSIMDSPVKHSRTKADILGPRPDIASPTSMYSCDVDGRPQGINESMAPLASFVGGRSAIPPAMSIHQQPVTYSVDPPHQDSYRPQHAPQTSKDWRMWASNEVAELDSSPPNDIRLPSNYMPKDSGHRRERTQIEDEGPPELPPCGYGPGPALESVVESRMENKYQKENQRATTPSGRDSPMLREVALLTPGRTRPKLTTRSSSKMNERFPMIETRRKASSQTLRTIPKAASVPDTEPLKPPNPGFLRENVGTGYAPPAPVLRKPQSIQQLSSSNNRTNSSLAQYTTNARFSPKKPLPHDISRSKSSLAQYTTNPSLPSDSLPSSRMSGTGPTIPPRRPFASIQANAVSGGARRPRSSADLAAGYNESPTQRRLRTSRSSIVGGRQLSNSPEKRPHMYVPERADTPVTGSLGLDLDHTLQRIARGPYAHSNSNAPTNSSPLSSHPHSHPHQHQSQYHYTTDPEADDNKENPLSLTDHPHPTFHLNPWTYEQGNSYDYP